MQHRDQIILEKVLSEIKIGSEMIENLTLEAFLKDEMRKRAVCMTTINIGELVKNVSDEIKIAFPWVEWKAIAGMRDLYYSSFKILTSLGVFSVLALLWTPRATPLRGSAGFGRQSKDCAPSASLRSALFWST